MKEIFEFIERQRQFIGTGPFLMIGLAFLVVTFQEKAAKGDERISKGLTVLAGALIALGAICVLLKLVAPVFRSRPAKGLIDGLAAGLVAGFVGGLLGYGSHSEYVYHNGYIEKYVESPYMRIALCVMFSGPIGGVLGILLDLVHPDRVVDWRKWIGAVFLAFVVSIFMVVIGVACLVPDMDGAGIIVSDLQLLFEIYLCAIVISNMISLNWPWRKIAARLPILFFGILVGRVATLLIPAQIDGFKVPLCKKAFSYDIKTVAAQRLFGDSYNAPYYEMGFCVVAFMAWTGLVYLFFYRDHSFSKWLQSKVSSSNETISPPDI